MKELRGDGKGRGLSEEYRMMRQKEDAEEGIEGKEEEEAKMCRRGNRKKMNEE